MSTRDPNVIDGFASVQALKRASARSAIKPKLHDSTDEPSPAKQAADAAESADTAKAMPAAPSRAGGHVAVPSKRLVICYACGYSHTVSGHMHNSFCPKCKIKLNTEDVTVAGRHVENILTIGNVAIMADAEFAPGLSITGQNITLDGDATTLASITATESLEIRSNAKFNAETLHNITGKIIIAAENEVHMNLPLRCSQLEIFGCLRAQVSVTQSAHIRSGGLLEGAFHGPTLLVDEGGGLMGDVDLSPAYRPEPEKNTKVKTARKAASAIANAVLMGFGMVASLVCCVSTR